MIATKKEGIGNGEAPPVQNGVAKANSKITSSHLLASNFVPSNLKAINEAPVSAYVQTKAAPSMSNEINRVYSGLLGGSDPLPPTPTNIDDPYLHPAAVAKMKAYNQKMEQKNERPNVVTTVNEAKFVHDQVRKRLVASTKLSGFSISTKDSAITTTKEPLTGTLEAAKTVPAIGTDMVPGGQDRIGTTQNYLAVFRELLQVEYAEIQRLFVADYDNYKVKITIPNAESTKGGKVNNGVGQFKMNGIADGRPSIRPGDTVLVRPHHPIYLPHHQYVHPAIKHLHYGQPSIPPPAPFHIRPGYHGPPNPHTIEIKAQVLAVNRGTMSKKGNVQKDTILISWVEDAGIHQQIHKKLCSIRFVPSTTTHERCLTALDWLRSIRPEVARDLLFPYKVPKLPPSPAIDESSADADTTEEREYEQLNQNQARFVQMVTARTAHPTKDGVRPPMVLTGPAGTGKTKTILATILQILRKNHGQEKPRSRILICTPSHTACDVITERLVNFLSTTTQSDQLRKTVFRLYDATRPVETVPVQILPYTRQIGDGGKFSLPDPQVLLGFSVIVCTCHDAHLLYMAGLTNASLRRRRRIVKLDIERRLRDSGLEFHGAIEGENIPHFTHLFIDEAAQATEPECLIPLSVVVDDDPGATKVEIALCGDPRQLGPGIYSPAAMEGLQRSLLERLLRLPVETYGGGRNHLMGPPTADSLLTLDEMIEYSFQKTDYRENLSVFLNLSYRGHPSFLYMPSKLFYFDKLKSIASKLSNEKWISAIRRIESLTPNAYPASLSQKQMDWPLVFHGVKGKCTSTAIEYLFRSNCWCNHQEANVVVQIVQQICKEKIHTGSIGVMAPFRAQVVLIRKLLRAKGFGGVNVGMVEDYQSMERDIIILSLTRSNKSLVRADVNSGEGLFHQNKRMNVALTRAQHALVVVGEPNTMKEDPAWSQWLGFCKDNGLWYGESGEDAATVEE